MALMKPRNLSITIGNAISDPFGTATTFKTQLDAVGSNELTFEKLCTEIEIKEPENTGETIKTLGATSGNQNQELDPQSPTKAEFTATILASPDDDLERDLEQFKLTASGTKPSGYTRYNYGSAAPSAGVCVVAEANMGSGKPIIDWMLNNAIIETLGGVKIDAEGHGTQDIRVSCAADDFGKEFDVDGGS